MTRKGPLLSLLQGEGRTNQDKEPIMRIRELSRNAVVCAGALLSLALSSPSAVAQPTWQYTYTGNPFTRIYGAPYTTAIFVTASFKLPEPLPAGATSTIPGITPATAAAFQVTMSDGQQTISTSSPLFRQALEMSINATDANGLPSLWYIILLSNPTVSPFQTFPSIQSFGHTAGAVVDYATLNLAGQAAEGRNGGTWTVEAPSTASIAAGLLSIVTNMNIEQQGNSLIAQLLTVQTDINNNTLGLACSDLSIFAEHVTAQTGKKITVDQAAKIQAWVGYLSKSIPCQ
jgi:hypothetical protein